MKTQKRLAAEILKTGTSRVWIDPDMIEEIEGAMTRGDIRKYVGLGLIKAKIAKSNSRGRVRARQTQKKKGRRRGHGKREGGKKARLSKKQIWMRKIRAQRKTLKELRTGGKIDKKTYRKTYSLSTAGTFKSKAHMITYLKEGRKK